MATWNSLKLVERLIEEAEAKLRLAFGEVVLGMKDAHTLDALAELIAAGQYTTALEMTQSHAAKLASAINRVYVDAGQEAIDSLGRKLGVVVSYDQTNYRALRRMEANRLELVREFTERQVEATRAALLDGIERGLNPRAMAREFRDSIGLTQSQLRYVSNYRRQLETLDPGALARRLRDARFDRTVFDAIDHESPLPKSVINKLVQRYRERWIAHRAETIARHEALQAAHGGVDEAIQQAIENGAFTPEEATSKWHTARDERVRDPKIGATTSHRTMHGQERPYGEPFESGAGNLLRYPGDPTAPLEDTMLCRCRMGVRVKT